MKNLTGSVIEIEEVELLITKEAAEQISREEPVIKLRRLVDQKDIEFSLKEVKASIFKGIIDRLDIK